MNFSVTRFNSLPRHKVGGLLHPLRLISLGLNNPAPPREQHGYFLLFLGASSHLKPLENQFSGFGDTVISAEQLANLGERRTLLLSNRVGLDII